mmetsp:Transcript_66858/g.204744  ORF Transcript_66858/g.204744 Transcript_66858/m.204744 type:complete len:263 (+) Transcript_66858:3261-4049(+)
MLQLGQYVNGHARERGLRVRHAPQKYTAIAGILGVHQHSCETDTSHQLLVVLASVRQHADSERLGKHRRLDGVAGPTLRDRGAGPHGVNERADLLPRRTVGQIPHFEHGLRDPIASRAVRRGEELDRRDSALLMRWHFKGEPAALASAPRAVVMQADPQVRRRRESRLRDERLLRGGGARPIREVPHSVRREVAGRIRLRVCVDRSDAPAGRRAASDRLDGPRAIDAGDGARLVAHMDLHVARLHAQPRSPQSQGNFAAEAG